MSRRARPTALENAKARLQALQATNMPRKRVYLKKVMRLSTVMVLLTFAEGGVGVEKLCLQCNNTSSTLIAHSMHILAGGCQYVQAHCAKVAQPMLRGCANPFLLWKCRLCVEQSPHRTP